MTPPTEYGSRIRAQKVYFNAYHFIPLERTAELMSELYQQPVSDGTVAATVIALAECVEPVNAPIKAYLVETGERVNGKLWWLHVASTRQATYYAIHPKRGREALDAMDILPQRSGWSSHDAFVSYLNYPDAKHGLCNGHLVRELVFLIEQRGQQWACELLEWLLTIQHTVERAKQGGQSALLAFQLSFFEQTYDKILATAERKHPSPARPANQRGRLKQSPERNLLDRLIRHKDKGLAFVGDFDVPFDNNLAERDIRMVKIQQKVSGGFRTPDGANVFCQVRAFISTARKNGQRVLDVLSRAFQGTPYRPPCILPLPVEPR